MCVGLLQVLLVIYFIINIRISCVFVYFYWYLKRDNANITNIDANTETVNLLNI